MNILVNSYETLKNAILAVNAAEERAVIEFEKGAKIVLKSAELLEKGELPANEGAALPELEDGKLPGNTGISLLPDIMSKYGVAIEGNGAEIEGDGQGTALVLRGEGFVVERLQVHGFNRAIFICAREEDTKDVTIRNCDLRDMNQGYIMTGIENSGHVIEKIEIADNFFMAPDKIRGGQAKGACACATCLFTALYDRADHPIRDVALRGVHWARNVMRRNPDGNQFAEGVMAHGAADYNFFGSGDMFVSAWNEVSDSVFEDLVVEDNDIDGVHDIGITLLAGFPARHDCLLQNVTLRRNKITYFNTGINVGAANQCCSGDVDRLYARHIVVEDNELIPQVPGPFEPQIGVMIFTTRCESQQIRCEDCGMEDITVRNNKIGSREVGIAIEAQHGTQELPNPSKIARCFIRDLKIENNEITGAQLPIRMFAVHMEGRIDDFWGLPVPAWDPSLPFSTLAEGNSIDDVVIRGNKITEYDTAYTIGAGWACNHGFVKDNTIGRNIVIEDNVLDKGKKVFSYDRHIMNELLYEDAAGSGNRVLADL